MLTHDWFVSRRFTLRERRRLERYLKGGDFCVSSLARRLGRCHSALVYEFRRCPLATYNAEEAHRLAVGMRRCRGQQVRLEEHEELRFYVVERLRLFWSPEQIAGRLGLQEELPQISGSAIRRWVNRNGEYAVYLREHGKRRHRRVSGGESEPSQRRESGSLEVDSLECIRGSDSIHVHVFGETQFIRLYRIAKRNPDSVAHVVQQTLRRHAEEGISTLVFDYGRENMELQEVSSHYGLERRLVMRPWEKGLVEGINRLLRDFFPYQMDFSLLSDAAIQAVEDALNDRPRKLLDWHTPAEVSHVSDPFTPLV